MNWQPIETAKRELGFDRVLIATTDGKVVVARWDGPANFCDMHTGETETEAEGWLLDNGEPVGAYNGEPAYWMPLPTAPETPLKPCKPA